MVKLPKIPESDIRRNNQNIYFRSNRTSIQYEGKNATEEMADIMRNHNNIRQFRTTNSKVKKMENAAIMMKTKGYTDAEVKTALIENFHDPKIKFNFKSTTDFEARMNPEKYFKNFMEDGNYESINRYYDYSPDENPRVKYKKREVERLTKELTRIHGETEDATKEVMEVEKKYTKLKYDESKRRGFRRKNEETRTIQRNKKTELEKANDKVAKSKADYENTEKEIERIKEDGKNADLERIERGSQIDTTPKVSSKVPSFEDYQKYKQYQVNADAAELSFDDYQKLSKENKLTKGGKNLSKEEKLASSILPQSGETDELIEKNIVGKAKTSWTKSLMSGAQDLFKFT